MARLPLVLALLATLAAARCPPTPTGAGDAAPGRPSGPVEPSEGDRIYEILSGAGVEEKLRALQGMDQAASMTVCYYTKQVVAGMMYEVVVSTSDSPGSPAYAMTIFEPLPYTRQKPSIRGLIRAI
mmetsp:Transcript_108699/g.313900  ORF Transcript_108699/g.313900 Transcript_108699/m.313900 type:complete len:126 (-) Transcript_108699:202-579(-)